MGVMDHVAAGPLTSLERIDAEGVAEWRQPLENFRIFESESCDEANTHFCATLAPASMMVGKESSFRSTHSRTRFGQEWINAILYESSITINARVPADTYLLSLTLSGSCAFQNEGGELQVARAGELIMVNPDERFTLSTTGDYSNLVFQIDRDGLDKTLATEMGGPLPSKLVFDGGCFHDPALGRFIRLCCAELESGTLDSGWDAVSRSYARTFHTLLLNGRRHSLTAWMNRDSLSMAAPYYVRRAEEFIRAHSHEPLTLHHISQAANISPRSLHNGFRRFRGQTPMSYLKMVRLERVHQELRTSKSRGRTITEIAFDHGFNHMSKFGYDYRLRFGELPSKTTQNQTY